MAGNLKAGERLNLDQLSKHFGVSRMPVRDALKQLQAEGLVVIHPHSRVEVVTLDVDDIEELFEMREALESRTVEKAVSRLETSDLARMRQILERMDRGRLNNDHWLKLNNEFHRIINQASGWHRFVESIEVLRVNVDRYLRNYLSIRGRDIPSQQHWALFEACRTGDVNEARQIIAGHIGDTGRALVAYLRE